MAERILFKIDYQEFLVDAKDVPELARIFMSAKKLNTSSYRRESGHNLELESPKITLSIPTVNLESELEKAKLIGAEHFGEYLKAKTGSPDYD